MTIIDHLKKFATKKRSWKWIAAGFAVAAIGHLLEGVPVISRLQGLSTWLASSLKAVQPFAIVGAFMDAARGHRGLWFCEPIGSFSSSDRCNGLIELANNGLASLFAIPRVATAIWQSGGVISTLLFMTTVVAMGMMIVGAWRDIDKPNGGFGQAVLNTIGLLALGPLAAGAIFWALLQLLLFLTFIFGTVLAGVAWCIATLGTAYKVGAFVFGAVKSGDELQENATILTGKEGPPEA